MKKQSKALILLLMGVKLSQQA